MRKIIKWLIKLLIGIFGWIFIVPLSYLIPKKKDLIIFIGSKDGRFIDNSKYFFLYVNTLKEKNIEYYFLTENREILNSLKNEELPVIFYPTLFSIIKLLRTSTVILDSWWWFQNLKYHALINSYKVQLWHGIGLKKIELSLINKSNIILNLLTGIMGRYPTYDVLISTSEFYTKNFFRGSFKTRFILESGLPRNDSFFVEHNKLMLLGSDKKCIEKIKNLKLQKTKIVLYVPTFRDTGGDAIEDKILDIKALSEFGKKHNILFIFKFHLAVSKNHVLENIANLMEYNNDSDIYPVMPLIDLMISDYSSIHLDYLLLDKPVMFFSYDYEKYITRDREILFDYDWITPGPKCKTQEELHNEIFKILIEGKDEYKEQRKEILDIAFKYKDGKACERIWDFIKKEKKL